MAEKQIEDLKAPLFDPQKTARAQELIARLALGLSRPEAKAIYDGVLSCFQTAGEVAKGADPGWIESGGKAEGVIAAIKQKVAVMTAEIAASRSPQEPVAFGVAQQIESAVNCHYTHVAGYVVNTVLGRSTGAYQPPSVKDVEHEMQLGATGEHDVMGSPMREPHTRSSSYKGRPPSGGSPGGGRGE